MVSLDFDGRANKSKIEEKLDEVTYKPWVGSPNPDVVFAPTVEQGEEELSPDLDYRLDARDPPFMLVPRFIGDKVIHLPGEPSAGKSHILAMLGCNIAGLMRTPGFVRSPPRIVYLCERPEQAVDVLYGFSLGGCFGSVTSDYIRSRFFIKKLPRLMPKQWGRYISFIVKKFTEPQMFETGTLFIPPVIMIDTLSSAINLGDENSNAELTDALTEMEKGTVVPRLAFHAPLLVTDHTPKGEWGTGKPSFGRGAGAKRGEADQIVGVHRSLIDPKDTFLEVIKPPRRGNAHPMVKVRFDSVRKDSVGMFGELVSTDYWHPVAFEFCDREEYDKKVKDEKGARKQEQLDESDRLDKEHAIKVFKFEMCPASGPVLRI